MDHPFATAASKPSSGRVRPDVEAWATDRTAGSTSVVGMLHLQAIARADQRFITFNDEELTYGAFEALSDALATSLLERGIQPGELVGVWMFNSPDMLITTIALAKIGAVPVMLNTDYKGDLLTYVLNDCGARLVIIDDELVERLLEVLESCPAIETIVTRGDEEPRASIPTSVECEKFEYPAACSTPPRKYQASTSDPYMVIYTSGTTGPSKGVVVSNGHCLTFSQDWVTAMEFTSEDVLYSPLPLFHGIAYILGFVACAITGAEFHIARKFSARGFWPDVRKSHATVAHLIFGIVSILLGQPPCSLDRQHSLRAVYIGPSGLNDAFEERFGASVVEVYGQTETGIVTYGPIGKTPAGSCGKVNAPRFDIIIADDDDQEMPPGQRGEILVRPKQTDVMMLGYLNKPLETIETYRNLWHHSGDLGYLDSDGWLHFLDRKKDSIRRMGENVSSFELEALVSKHPDIAECAAIPVNSDLGEDEIKMCVVLRPGAEISMEAVYQFCVATLPRFMIPRYIEVLGELPKTPSQKVEKYKLKAISGQPDLWDSQGASRG